MGHGGYQYETSVVVTPDGYRPLLDHDTSFRILDTA